MRSFKLYSTVYNFKKYTFLIVYAFLVWMLGVAAEAKVPEPVIVDDSPGYSLKGKLEYIEDRTRSLTIDAINAEKDKLRFSILESDLIYLGFSDSAYWIRFTLKNPDPEKKKLIFEIYNPLIDSVKLYIPAHEGQFRIKTSGREGTFSNRQILHRNILFGLTLAPNSAKTCVLRLESQDLLLVPVKLWLESGFIKKDRQEQVLYGAFFGMLFLTILFSITVIVVLRDRSFFFYMLLVAGVGFLVASETGFGYEYLWPKSTGFFQWSSSFFAAATVIFLNLFSRQFLNLKKHLPAADTAVIVYTAICFISLFFIPSIPVKEQSIIASIHGTLSPAFILFLSIVMLRRGFKPARFFVVSFFIAILSTIMYSLSVFNIVPFTITMLYVFLTGIILTTFTLNLALVDRFVSLTRELETERGMLKERNDQMEIEINLARELQLNLIPDSGPFENIASIYLPMEKVGGDFYDFVRFRDTGKIGVFICDVTGHGVPAAFITSMLKTALMQAGNRRHDPAQMLEYLNDILIRQTIESFVTCIYCVFDRKTRLFHFGNAGHPYPLVIHDNSLQELIGIQNMPLAVYDNASLREMDEFFKTNEFYLKENSKLVLYTDGLSEASPPGQYSRIFKKERMEAVLIENGNLKGDDFIDAIVQNLVAFTGNDDFADDICIISIDVT